MRISQNLDLLCRFIPNFFLASFPTLFLSLSFLFIFYLLSPSCPLGKFWPQPFKKPGKGRLINYRWRPIYHQFCTQNWTRFSGIALPEFGRYWKWTHVWINLSLLCWLLLQMSINVDFAAKVLSQWDWWLHNKTKKKKTKKQQQQKKKQKRSRTTWTNKIKEIKLPQISWLLCTTRHYGSFSWKRDHSRPRHLSGICHLEGLQRFARGWGISSMVGTVTSFFFIEGGNT